MRREEDFILRLIQQMAAVIHYALGLRGSSEIILGHETIEQAIGDLLPLSTRDLVQLGAAKIRAMMELQAGVMCQAKTAVLAWLLAADGQISKAAGDEQGNYGRSLTALELLLGLAETGWETEEEIPTVTDVAARLADFVLPAQTYLRLLAYFERQENFGAAEDALYAWLENWEEAVLARNGEGDANPLEVGIAFYRRLLQQDDSTLESGNLPRAEAEAGLEEIRRWGE